MRFVREKPLVEAVASSLTELFAPSIHKRRIAGMLANYDFIDEKVVAYFRRRLDQAPKDAEFALDYVKRQRPHRRAAARRDRGAHLQDRRAVGAARRAAPRLCRRRRSLPAPSGRPEPMDDRSSSNPGRVCRAASSSGVTKCARRWTLLAPERIFEVDATAAAVLELCDGERDLAGIVAELARPLRRARGGDRKGRRRHARRPQGQEGARNMTAHSPRRLRRRSGCWSNSRIAVRSAVPIAPIRSRSSAPAPNSTGRPGSGCSARRPRSARCTCIFPAASRRRGATSSSSPGHAVAAGLYTNLITSGIGVEREALRANSSTPASIMRSCRSRAPTRRPTTGSAITRAPGRRSAPSPPW